MKLFDLCEARRNKNHPAQQVDRVPGNGSMKSNKTVNELLKPYEKDENIYISFTSLPKIGINPKSNFASTPLGIYAYPLKEIVEKSKRRHTDDYYNTNISYDVPYAGEEPFIMVLKSTDELMDVSDYTKMDLEHDLTQIKELIGEREFRRLIENEKVVDFPFAIGKIKGEDGSSYPISKLWRLTYTYAVDTTIINDPVKSNKISIRWNKLLSLLGYDGFSDKLGLGFIHSAEPLQVFFLNKSSFELVKMFKNPISSFSKLSLHHDKQKLPAPMSISHYRELLRQQKIKAKIGKMSESEVFEYIKKSINVDTLSSYELNSKINDLVSFLPEKCININLLNFFKTFLKDSDLYLSIIRNLIKSLYSHNMDTKLLQNWLIQDMNNLIFLPSYSYFPIKHKFDPEIIEYTTDYNQLTNLIPYIRGITTYDGLSKIIKKSHLMISTLLDQYGKTIPFEYIVKMLNDPEIVPPKSRLSFLHEISIQGEYFNYELVELIAKFAPKLFEHIKIPYGVSLKILSENPNFYKKYVPSDNWPSHVIDYFNDHK